METENMYSIQPESATDQVLTEHVDAVMAATRVLVALTAAVTAQSVAALNGKITLAQLRVLVVIASQGPRNLASVAQSVKVHPSSATRACDKLVEAGLLERTDDPADRRNLILRLTDSGWELVESMNISRREAISSILARMPAQQRGELAPAMAALVRAADEIPSDAAWSLGWMTGVLISGR
jgi:DNA-binding MarR family transcriptional regulator